MLLCHGSDVSEGENLQDISGQASCLPGFGGLGRLVERGGGEMLVSRR